MATRTEKMLAALVRFQVNLCTFVPTEAEDAARLAREILKEETDEAPELAEPVFPPPVEQGRIANREAGQGGAEEETEDPVGLD
jgi:hypothetical protein